MAFSLPTMDTANSVDDLGAFATGSVHLLTVSGFANKHLYGSSVQLGASQSASRLPGRAS